MNVEIQVALNFLISFLYNKLPRRRVNNFGEELEAALKLKFEGHWYPDKPFKGSAFRCIKTTPPLDPVFEIAARESGMDICDIQENLPRELSIWVDPGEVSYRMSEKGPVKILYSETDRINDYENSEREVTRTFNPEAQCFKPVDLMASQFSQMSMTPGSKIHMNGNPVRQPACMSHTFSPQVVPPVPFTTPTTMSSLTGFGPKQSNNNVTLTAGMFAQTKFGSTKLKNSGKRSQRMSPTEFGNYIKQKALMQQQQQQQHQQHVLPSTNTHQNSFASNNTANPLDTRSISPESPGLDVFAPFMSNSDSQTPSPPICSNAGPFGAYPSGFLSRRSVTGNTLFDHNDMDDLFGPLNMTEADEHNDSLSRYANSIFGQPFAPGSSSGGSSVLGSSPESGGGEVGPNSGIGSQSSLGSNSSNGSRTFENNVSSSYPNQYQHLLLAN